MPRKMTTISPLYLHDMVQLNRPKSMPFFLFTHLLFTTMRYVLFYIQDTTSPYGMK